jgi:hypothetical protein
LDTNFYEISAKMSDEAVVIALGSESDFGLTILNRLKMSKHDSLDYDRKFLAMICEGQPPGNDLYEQYTQGTTASQSSC